MTVIVEEQPTYPGEILPSNYLTPIRLRVSGLEQLRVAGNVLGPKLPHYSLHIIKVKAAPIRMLVAKLTHAQDPRIWIAGMWRKGRIGGRMNNPLRRNIVLVAPD